MTTLNNAPVAAILDGLLDADRSWRLDIPGIDSLSTEERQRLMQSKTEYRGFYGLLKDAPLAVSRETGTLLYMLARSIGAQTIVEFGTSFGVSTLHLAAALRDNGGGRLITTEFEPSKVTRAKANLVAAGLADLVEFREGDALATLADDVPEAIDMLLLDGAKGLYPDILKLVEGQLRPGALIIADNADHSPDYLARVRTANGGYLSVPFGPDVELSMRVG
ncbi:O-methyltransferase [Sphingomonas sp.]|uniref:O-methyltransferase n=1 Tax=Sphingomonas sp. TaxID=28214 RepID=UPI003B3B582D